MMKTNLLTSMTLALGLAAGAASAIAATPTDLLGDVVTPAEATRTVAITPSTAYVNVAQGDVVTFVANGRSFAFRFDGAPSVASFDLRQVAPAGMLDHAVVAYVAPEEGTSNGVE